MSSCPSTTTGCAVNEPSADAMGVARVAVRCAEDLTSLAPKVSKMSATERGTSIAAFSLFNPSEKSGTKTFKSNGAKSRICWAHLARSSQSNSLVSNASKSKLSDARTGSDVTRASREVLTSSKFRSRNSKSVPVSSIVPVCNLICGKPSAFEIFPFSYRTQLSKLSIGKVA